MTNPVILHFHSSKVTVREMQEEEEQTREESQSFWSRGILSR